MLYTGTELSKQVLSIFEPALYTIRYPMVIPSGSKIHILLPSVRHLTQVTGL